LNFFEETQADNSAKMDAMNLSREMIHEEVINIKAAIALSGTLASTVAPL
jgi:hypothetical protein